MTHALDLAIAQELARQTQEAKAAEQHHEQERKKREEEAIAQLKLPFDEKTQSLLPPCRYEFGYGNLGQIRQISVVFEYRGLEFRLNQVSDSRGYEAWTMEALEPGNDGLDSDGIAFNSFATGVNPEFSGRQFVIWVGQAVMKAEAMAQNPPAPTPTTPPKPTPAQLLAESPASERTLLQEFAGRAMERLNPTTITKADYSVVIDSKKFAEQALEIAQAMIDTLAK